MKRITGTSLLLISVLLFTGATSVFAAPMGYIDPNTGGMIFQVLAVLFATLSGFVFLFASKIKMGFARFKRVMREKMGKEIIQEDAPQA